MSKLSKKAILSVLSLVLTFVALGATTFAWFTLGNTASVGQFDAEIRGSEGLEIRFGENGDWLTNISSEVMKGYIQNHVENKLNLEAVSVGDNFDDFFKSNNDSNQIAFETKANKNEDYLEFDLYFRTTQENSILSLKNLSLTSQESTWQSDMDFMLNNEQEVEKDEDITVYAHEAARISFHGKENTVYEAPESDTNIGIEQEFGANAYLAKKLGMTNEDLFNLKENQAKYPTKKTDTGFESLKDIVTFETNVYNGVNYNEGKLTVRVWIEGWDGNAFDAIFGKTIQVSFDFALEDAGTNIEG